MCVLECVCVCVRAYEGVCVCIAVAVLLLYRPMLYTFTHIYKRAHVLVISQFLGQESF